MDYSEADRLLKGRCKDSRKIDNNTYLKRRAGDAIAVLLHETDIVTFCADGRTVLNSGKWRTATTKDRLQKFAPVHVWQQKGIWYVGENWNAAPLSVFYDGMIIDPDGAVIDPRKFDGRVLRIQKELKKYLKVLRELDELPVPDNGDCWYCLFRNEEGETMGDLSEDVSHLENHLHSNYIHGSLIFNALEAAGYREPGFIFQYGSRDQIVRAVSRYFKRKLGVGY